MAAHPSSLVTIPFPNQPDELIDVRLSARTATLAVDEMVTVQVTLGNNGQISALFDLEVLGLDADWLIIPDLKLKLEPGQQKTIPITIKPPRLPESRAGVHHFAVKVTSSVYPQRYCQQRATLTILPYYDFIVEALTPKQQLLSWLQVAAIYTLSLTNIGNTSTRFTVIGSDQEASCHFEFQLPDEATLTAQADLLLLPRETVTIPIRVTPASDFWVGIKRHTHFTITTVSESGSRTRSVLGQLSQQPLLGPRILAVIVAGLLLLGTGLLWPFFGSQPEQMTLDNSIEQSMAAHPESLPVQPTLKPTVSSELPASQQSGYEHLFKQVAPHYDLDWRLLEAMAYRESRLNHQAVGAANDLGLMQVLPSTWNEWAPKLNVSDPFDPHSNILVGAAYLAYVRDFCHSRGYREPQWMLIAYNWGPAQLDFFLKNGGTWADIPLMQRQYALTILDMAAQRSSSELSAQDFYTFEMQ